MGRGGGKGEGDEDTEHQRPAYLLEADPDDALVGELPELRRRSSACEHQ